jgi:hypothetical protein
MAFSFASIGSWFTSLLNSSQLQSIGRTALKVGGALLIAKYGVDANSVESVIGGVAAGAGIISSIKAHASAPAVSTSDIISAAVQAAVEGVLAKTAAPATGAPANPTPVPAAA